MHEQDQAVQADTLQLGGLEDQLADMEVAGATDPATRSVAHILPELTPAKTFSQELNLLCTSLTLTFSQISLTDTF